MDSKQTYRTELRTAIRHLSDRCLYSASKWAAEQLVGIEPDWPSPKYAAAAAAATSSHYVRPLHRGSGSGAARSRRTPVSYEAVATPVTNVSYVRTPVFVEEEVDGDCFLLAKSYFDCREYRQAAHALRDQTRKKATFLRCYALYLEKLSADRLLGREGGGPERRRGNASLSATVAHLVCVLEDATDSGRESTARALLKLSHNSDNAWSVSAQGGVTVLLKIC